MAAKLKLVLACGDYEIVRPLVDGEIEVEGVELTILTGMDSSTRHWRFLRNREFEIAEVSCSSYLIARAQGHPFDAIPVFLHRRFRHGFVYINTKAGIGVPRDLIGRRVGVKSFQVTATLWLRGILEHEYDVPHKSIEWISELDEDVVFVPRPDLRLTKIADDRTLESMLVAGELDALLHPDIIEPIVRGDPAIARLFPDYKWEEIAYFRRTGIFPIMHVLGIRRDVAERHPWLAINLFQAFERAKAIAMQRMENPRMVPLAWFRTAWEEQQAILGRDPWAYGLTEQNRNNLETLVGYSHEQGLIGRRMPLDELFLPVSPGRKRGTSRY